MSSGNGLEEDRNLLFRSEDLEWVDDVSGFQCVRCNKVLIRHNIANCGHKFCPNCKNILDDGSKSHRCPLPECKKIIEKIHLEDSYFEETVYELRAHCPNHKYGCPFIGPLNDVKGHLKTCEDIKKNEDPKNNHDEQNKSNDSFTLKEMTKLSEKMETMSSTLSEMQKWMREMKEERLAQDRKWAELENKWAEVDKRTDSIVSRLQEVSTRIETCAENENQLKTEMKQMTTQFSREISELKTKLKENKEKNQEKSSPKTEQEVNNTFVKPEIHQLRRVSEYYKEKPDFTWTVSQIQTLLSGSRAELLSEVFPVTGYPFGAEAKLTLSGFGTVNVSLTFKNVNNAQTKQIPVKPFPKIYVTLKDLFNDKDREDLVMTRDFTPSDKLEYDWPLLFVTFEKTRLNSNVYNDEGRTLIDLHVEAPEVARTAHSTDGSLTWAINDHTKRKRMEIEGLMEYQLSPYFYTRPNGHRVQAKAYLNGHFKYEKKGVSLLFAFSNGPYDEALDKNYPHRTTVTIFHPQQPHRNVSQSVEKDNIGRYQINVGTHKEVQELLHEDTLFYKVIVEAIQR